MWCTNVFYGVSHPRHSPKAAGHQRLQNVWNPLPMPKWLDLQRRNMVW